MTEDRRGLPPGDGPPRRGRLAAAMGIRAAAAAMGIRAAAAAMGIRAAAAAMGIAAAAGAAICVAPGEGAGAAQPDGEIRAAAAPAKLSGPLPAPRGVTATAEPGSRPEVLVRVGGADPPAAQPAVDLRQIVYTVAGNQRPDDPVTVVYADETGSLRTVGGVTLPWTMTVIPDLPVRYVYATSRGSQLNCWITDAAGATAASRTDYGASTSCNN